MRYSHTKGIILNSSIVKETDKNVLIFTEHFGKISSVAPGAAKSTAKLSFGLEPFCESDLMIYNLRSFSRSRITSAVLVENLIALRNDFTRSLTALNCIALFEKITPWFEPDKKKYQLLKRTLELLSTCNNPQKIMLAFQLRLVKQCGYDFYRYSRVNRLDMEIISAAGSFVAMTGVEIDELDIPEVVEKKMSRTLDVYINSIIMGNI